MIPKNTWTGQRYSQGRVQGYGKEWFHTGDYYEGNAFDGHWQGQGTYKHWNGQVYEGSWANSLRNGHG